MKKITLTMPYYHNSRRYYELTLQVVGGFVDVLDGDGDVIYSGYTVDAINFISALEN